ncbi:MULTISPECIES: tetratricopeptide repeat protein [unclassified Wenzhouxiangella]|uniref:tetratricopeptide repeat protein n=1 Tax=unclassified Wenzhouxiangella TaxID=2613841 RepID=UPI000E32895B|nr:MULTISPECIES: tetratricopeptide repeat protein [unclassified Wenzhouxiangella]RFF27485.1 hypothetical protein DZK25_07270 [Wenzhouxiangella sp. 15181]RFP69653.1 hypothetical protein DZK26_03375 [Wenzhouxiangella sp. 15190]
MTRAEFTSILAAMLLAGAAGKVLADDQQEHAPLIEGLGDHHHEVTTDSPEAQRYFNQGLVLAFGFNHGEAHRSFTQAARIDPDCAMCWWGAAWVLGPNINTAMDPEMVPEAWELLQKAEAAAEHASEREKAYIEALAQRYGPEPLEDRSSRDQAFSEAMGKVAEAWPDDLDAQVIYAEALMDTTPWDYWKENGKPKAVTETVIDTLDGVLERNPEHPMANHLFIHAVEAVQPERGLEAAKRLEDLVPGAGHLVHMPSHIYIRTGRYHDATRQNLAAIEADKRYLAQVEAQGVYPLGYVPHNYHFGWATATFEGRSELALRLAREMSQMVDEDAMRQRPLTTLQHYWITPVYALVRFGHWDEILEYEEPAKDLIYPRAVWHYARGMAYTRKGDLEDARAELQRLDELRDDESLKWVTVWDINKSRHILEIASHALRGEIAAEAGDYPAAIEALEQAVEREDELNYDEPPSWHYPVRQSLGAILLEAGHPERAAAVYREDLAKFPDNGWSLYGLMQALRAQDEAERALEVQQRFQEAWQHADVVLTSSRF